MTLTEEEKKQMSATCQKTSLLAVGCNLVLSEDKPEQASSVKRSGLCQTSAHAQWVAYHGAGHGSRLGFGSRELVWAERGVRGVRGGARQAEPRPRAVDSRADEATHPGPAPLRTTARDEGGRGDRIDCIPVPRSQLH